MEVKFGSYPYDVVREGRSRPAGAPISWSPEEIRAGFIQATRPDGTPVEIRWEEVANDPGWCKLDWVIADPVRGQLANASNMLDATWEAPDGSITPLDGYLDPYFQEIYLEAASVPIFSKLAKHVSADALDEYVSQLEREVAKYGESYDLYMRVLPGLTGLWQVSGRSDLSYEERVRLDTYYVRNWSVWLDLVILLRTGLAVLSGRGAY